MENKKLLKFLYKDIAEMEEIFAEKGKIGFDNFEMEFIQSRFAGAKQIIQILNEKEDQFVEKADQWASQPEELNIEIPSPVVSTNAPDKEFVDESEKSITERAETEVGGDKASGSEPNTVAETKVSEEPEESTEEGTMQGYAAHESEELEMDEEVVPVAGGQRLGDSFLKEKSVNDLLAGGNNKLEFKISNSPVTSIQAAIGINDRYQYIRELFDGSAENYAEAVADLDRMNTIQEAVAYLQLKYKWKKTDTSLKFVSLVKRRFANG